jgi:hypothetical protein
MTEPRSYGYDEALEVMRKMKEANKDLPPERAYTPDMVKIPFKDKYDIMAEDEAAQPPVTRHMKAHVMGAERGVDALNQFGANRVYPWLNKVLPEKYQINKDTVNKNVAEREKIRDARMRDAGWSEKIGHFLGSYGADPTSFVPGSGPGARVLQRGVSNAIESVASDQLSNPVSDPNNYEGQKLASGTTAALLGPMVGEAGHQVVSRAIPKILHKGEDIEGLINQGPFNKKNEFFDEKGNPSIELNEELKKHGWEWHGENMPQDYKDTVRAMAELFTRKPQGTTPKELANILSYKAIGVDPMLQNIKRDYGTWAKFQRLRNDELGGGPVREAFDRKNSQIQNFGKKMEAEMGATEKTREELGTLTMDTLKQLDDGELSRISRMYKEVGEYYDQAGHAPNALPVLKYLDGLEKTGSLSDQGLKVIKTVKRFMGQQGFIGDTVKQPNKFNFPQVVRGRKAPGKNPNDWEALRKSLNEAYDPKTMSKSEKRLIRNIKGKIDEHILDQAGDQFKAARRDYSAYMASKDHKILEKLIDDDNFDPAKMVNTLMTGPTKDLTVVKEYLLKYGDDIGRDMWNQIRGGIWMRSFRHGMQNYSGKNEAGDIIFSGSAFTKKFDNPDTGMTKEKRTVLFDEVENAQVDAFLEVMGNLEIPVHGTVNFSNTAYALINFIQGAGGIQGVHSPMFWLRKAFQATGSELETMTNIKQGKMMADIEQGFTPAKRADHYRQQKDKWAERNRLYSPMPQFAGDQGGNFVAGVVDKTGDAYDYAKEQIQQDIERRKHNRRTD